MGDLLRCLIKTQIKSDMGISQTVLNSKMLYNISSKARNRKFLGSKNEANAVTIESQKANLPANTVKAGSSEIT